MRKYIIDNFMTKCYPSETSKIVRNYGVLEKYLNKEYTREEIDKIICELITRHPYIKGSMRLELNIMWVEKGKGKGYYHMLSFRRENKEYKNEERNDNNIQFES